MQISEAARLLKYCYAWKSVVQSNPLIRFVNMKSLELNTISCIEDIDATPHRVLQDVDAL